MESDRIVPPHEAWRTAGVSRSTMYRLEQAGDFPRRVRISRGRSGYLMSELQQFIRNRAAERSCQGGAA